MSDENKQQDQQEQNGKDEKKYQHSLLKLQTLMGDRSLGLPNKLGINELNPVAGEPPVGETAIDALIRELFAEEFTKLKEEIKGDLKNLLTKNVEFQRFVKQKQKEFDEAVRAKKKEFTQEAEKVFNKITGIDEKVKETKKALQTTQQSDEGSEVK